MKCKNETIETVERILKANKNARDSDKTLILDYLLNHTALKCLSDTMKKKITKAVYTQVPPFETITRSRRYLQSKGHYVGDLTSQTLRASKEKAMRAMFR